MIIYSIRASQDKMSDTNSWRTLNTVNSNDIGKRFKTQTLMNLIISIVIFGINELIELTFVTLYYKSEDEGADHEETQKRLLSRNSLNSLEEPDKIAKILRKQDNGWMDTGLENNGEERSTNLEKIL